MSEIDDLRAEVERLTRERDEAVRALDPKYLRAAEYLLRNADKHPNACCPECAANGARVATLLEENERLRREQR